MLSRSEYQNWVNSIASPTSQADVALLNAARSVAQDRVLAAEIQLGKSQSLLTDFMPTRTTKLLPLPSDKPLIKGYKTRYELYSSNGLIPARLRGIDKMLPKMLELISQRAESVQAAKMAAMNAKSALTSRQTTVSAALEAGRLWRSAEADLIGTVTSYNKAIADYTMTITQGRQTPEQVVASLIGKPKAISPQAAAQQTAINQQRQFGQPNQFGNSGQANRQNQTQPFQNGQRPGSRVADGRLQNGRPPASARLGLGQPRLSQPAFKQPTFNQPTLGQPPVSNGGFKQHVKDRLNNGSGIIGNRPQTTQPSANPFGDSNANNQSFQQTPPVSGSNQFGG
jgi:hypothetical protein